MTTSKNPIWAERYRPKTLDDYVWLNSDFRSKMLGIIKSGELPHLLFTGVQGTGKSTLSQIIINELGINELDVLRVNASDERNIDDMRNKIKTFAMTLPIGDRKVIQLEEMDYLSPLSQPILRTIIEDYSAHCSFIGTANVESRIIPPLKSRFQHFDFRAPHQGSILERLINILELEEVEIDDDALDIIDKIVAASYPDIRKAITILQENVSDGKLHSLSLSSGSNADYHLLLVELIKEKRWFDARELVCSQIVQGEIEELYTWLYENRKLISSNQNTQSLVIVIIANHLYQHSLSANPEITLASCFAQISQVIANDDDEEN